MKLKQHTIKSSVKVAGVGLHTGVVATMTFIPASPNEGIRFQRIDLEGEPIIEADVDLVSDTSRGTTLKKGEATVSTIEHTLAALVALEIDNVLIQLSGPECPILDGSSYPILEALESVGVEEQNALRDIFEVPKGIFYSDPKNNIEIGALPCDDYRVTVMVDYNSPVLGSQHASLTNLSQFKNEIAPCRTFCFLHELEMLLEAGLIKGGDVDNAIVIVDREVQEHELDRLAKLFNKDKIEVKEGTLNNIELRYKNEPARHKLLDVMGDLALVGTPFKAQIMAARPGHAANVAFAKKLKKMIKESNNSDFPHYDPKLPPVYDVNKIAQTLAHRYPFALVDKIFHLNDTRVAGVKNITMNEPCFQGHFPENPIFPGVLQIEAMAQTGGILVLNTVPDPENYWTFFLGLENCKFRQMVTPGDTLILQCELLQPIKRGIAKMQGKAYVAGKLVAEAIMMARIVRKDA
ncbi:bifunctional UDP-3-O-[3-hydroxymyristoyl] N-acetylglucosamine deacetylase/3-hydroxyacyl-ACP dehydratase [Aureibacter tunicatorum]|uniref:Multifunctional fusion protein n=1 Tax=Aureibacter tunicatorum TaxID=866807 RepID=A0AAE4BVG0_9BACT|nr:bifunctional UDP-3-O-[3-hydroxymyristoyl] N-acetylglucosamine deacetylase/3-hydroxyacyl-ACP dehydratase [Aureibacter tunicatorum]MDR6242065.1 UDP-3-O-[3-hydroxymyristoyl] N-acetylglucosamine deacetylase/3-hydroxyacyl-[acyl-carrier-protein] dehydratase [Aureibacter tunicatorum]BDD03640.1 3-hydroxyacyl-[acyl-carrier-protein] dehydratase FabZ [Aureibacter tunicatorum]